MSDENIFEECSSDVQYFLGEFTLDDCTFEWTQSKDCIYIAAIPNSEFDSQSIKFLPHEDEIYICDGDLVKFHLVLYDSIIPMASTMEIEDDKLLIELAKANPEVNWSSVDRMDAKDVEMEEIDLKDAIPLLDPKTDYVERLNDTLILVYLYVGGIEPDSLKYNVAPKKITLWFTSSDTSFLMRYPGSNEKSVFEWNLDLKGEICTNTYSFKFSSSKIELKLRKTNTDQWGSLSEIDRQLDLVLDYAEEEQESASAIPPAPPAPPTPPAICHTFTEMKKPSTLLSPGKAMACSTRSNAGFSFAGNDSGTGGSSPPRGMVGLDNIGNTCFMNSVLQCLVNCRELREYFVEYNFQQDLNKDNPLGMGGKLAISFAILMRWLWSNNERSYAPTKLKSIMSLKANQFSGFAQHDAQEFMVELLDGLHEDLNRVKKKPYIAEPPDLDGWSDRDAADESWRLHKTRNDSIIDDLFKGQFKSTLTCHECGKISVKFDEFCCLSVPIPKDQKVLQVVFFWRDKAKRPQKFMVKVAADAFVDELKQQLSTHTGVHPTAIQVMETSGSKIHKLFSKCSTLSSFSSSDTLMAFEVLTEQEASEPVVELAVTQRMMTPNPPNKCASCSRLSGPVSKLKRCTKCFRVGYCNTNCQKNHWIHHKSHCRLVPEPVGTPFIMSLPESAATYTNLVAMAENYARYSVDIFQPPLTQIQKSRRTRNRKGSTSSGEGSSEPEEMEVDSEGSGTEMRECDVDGGSYSGEDRAEADWALSPKGGAVGGVSRRKPEVEGSERNGRSSSTSSSGSGGDEIPQLSSSPKSKTAPPQRTLTPATRLFTLRPTSTRSPSMGPPHMEPFNDKGNEPLDLTDIHLLAMDWCTNERLPVYCFIQNKSIECEEEFEDEIQHSKHTTLETCIDLFTQPENLSEGDSWRCPRCKKPVEATKQMCMWRLPSVLIIQLKRFSFKYVVYSDKIDKFVQYPLRGLDVAPFLSENAPETSSMYDLFGVINHMGRLLGGHYTAYCRTVDGMDSAKSEIDWRLCDDSRVNHVSESRVVHEQAYLLLYRRRDDVFRIPKPLPVVENGPGSDESPAAANADGIARDSSTESLETNHGNVIEPAASVRDELD